MSSEGAVNLPKEVKDFNVKGPLFYDKSDLKETLHKVIKALINASKTNKKVLKAIEYGIDAIGRYVNSVNSFYLNDGYDLDYNQLKNYLKRIDYVVRTEGKKRKMGFVYNPFYFIMIFILAKNTGFIKKEEDKRILDNESDPLNFSVDESRTSPQQYSQQRPSYSDPFMKNSWKLIDSLLQMLYGKIDEANPERKRLEMASITQYLYPFYLEVAQLGHSIDDVALLPDCLFLIMNIQNRNFLTKVFSSCPSGESGNQRGRYAYGPTPYPGYGGSRTDRKKAKSCYSFGGNLSTIAQLLQEQPNIICQIVDTAYNKFKQVNLDVDDVLNKKASSKINKTVFVKMLSKEVSYKKEDDEENRITSTRMCDYSKFYQRLYRLYLVIAKDILTTLNNEVKAAISSVTNSSGNSAENSAKKNMVRSQFESISMRVENNLLNFDGLSI